MRQIVVVLVHGEGVIHDCLLGERLGDGDEGLLVDLADGLAALIPHDVTIADLLVNRWVVDQCAAVHDAWLVMAVY